MKNFSNALVLIALVLISSTTANAKIWRLNNNGNVPNPPIVSDFLSNVTLQQAHDSAKVQSGDTIHIEQSPTTYGACIFTKRLVLIGAGYFLNVNPNTQANNSYGSIVGDLTFYNAGSAASQVFGCQVGNVNMGVSKLVIARCLFSATSCLIGNASTGNIDSMSLRQCYFTGSVGFTYIIRNNSGTGAVTNMNIYNNIIVPSYYGISLDNHVSGIFKNNLVSVQYNPISLSGFYVVNNISISNLNSSYPNNFTNCNVEYNVGNFAGQFVSGMTGTGTTYGTGNVTKTSAQIALLAGTSTDGYYQLQNTSEALTAAKDGTACGAFSGDFVYKLSGLAPIPNIYSIAIAPIAQGASSISVTVSAKGNN